MASTLQQPLTCWNLYTWVDNLTVVEALSGIPEEHQLVAVVVLHQTIVVGGKVVSVRWVAPFLVHRKDVVAGSPEHCKNLSNTRLTDEICHTCSNLLFLP